MYLLIVHFSPLISPYPPPPHHPSYPAQEIAKFNENPYTSNHFKARTRGQGNILKLKETYHTVKLCW